VLYGALFRQTKVLGGRRNNQLEMGCRSIRGDVALYLGNRRGHWLRITVLDRGTERMVGNGKERRTKPSPLKGLRDPHWGKRKRLERRGAYTNEERKFGDRPRLCTHRRCVNYQPNVIHGTVSGKTEKGICTLSLKKGNLGKDGSAPQPLGRGMARGKRGKKNKNSEGEGGIGRKRKK